MIHHQKLVRDRIPEIIQAAGKTPVVRVLSQQEYAESLDAKLDEELTEYRSERNVEELLDLVEIVEAIAVLCGIEWSEFERRRDEKRARRGGFAKRLMLDAVIGDDH